ncbi:acyl-CoA dehydrogenase family protein [Egicoccus sp. AB-alg2]|uniref:acyl-CoA dehydrogenase family protein n=1 Tax=Egicoccus sp. AB-alg2 TaxID=3242693 RepID=UPI00359D518C
MTTQTTPHEGEMTVTFVETDEQQQLRGMLRDFLGSRATSERVREVMQTDAGVDDAAWKELGEYGLLGLTVPEAHGGAGSTFVELAIVVEEAGKRLLPVPLLSSAVLGTTVLQRAGTSQQLQRWLPDVATGATRLALAHLDERGRLTADPGVRATRDGDGWRLTGTAGYVIDGHTADLLLTAAVTDDGLALFAVPGDAAGLSREPLPALDLTRPLATLRFDGVHVDAEAALTGGDPITALHDGIAAGVVALACEQVGGAQEVLSTTTAYARERIQFGRAIGSFQAVKHRLAEDLVKLEAARSAALHAARAIAAGDRQEIAIAAPMAKALCSEVYETIAADGIQLAGGIGFTWEHDAHLYFKRAKATKLLLGDPHLHRRLLGDVLSL